MFSSRPIEASSTVMLVEPAETNGSGTPVSGASPRTVKVFSSACDRMSDVIPAATSCA